ncbi:MAG: MarR family transcriptional regulator [Sphingobium sp.]
MTEDREKAIRGGMPRRHASDGNPIDMLGPLSGLLSVKLRQVDIILTRCLTELSASLGLRPHTLSSLGIIIGNPGMSQNELTLHSGTDKSTIVAIVDRLEELGWACRRRSATDRRKHSLFATEEGEAALRRIAAEVKRGEDQLLRGMAPDELDALVALLDKMRRSCVDAMEDAAS